MLSKRLTVHNLITAFALAVTLPAHAQLAPNAPADKPVAATEDQHRKLREAIAPLIEQARKSYPQAKARYLKGLPKGETFFVTTDLTDDQGHIESVFIQVTKIRDGKITGRIASQIMLVKGFIAGDTYTLPEDALVDWMISKPDGSEEGNLVGKFMDTYQPAS